MRKRSTFLIESERSGHRLFVNGQKIATFATLEAAEAEANQIANRTIPGTTLRFELDFKWTLTDLEIRTATLECERKEAAPLTNHQISPAGVRIGSGINQRD
jgi:hypothetical protein